MTSLHFPELENIEVRFIVLCLWYGSVVACHVIFFPKTWEWGTGNVYLLPLDPYFGHILKSDHFLRPISIMGVTDAFQHYHGSLLTIQNIKRPCYHATMTDMLTKNTELKFQFNSIIDVASYALYGASSDKPILFSQCEIL